MKGLFCRHKIVRKPDGMGDYPCLDTALLQCSGRKVRAPHTRIVDPVSRFWRSVRRWDAEALGDSRVLTLAALSEAPPTAASRPLH
ncbi:hypothetical protein GJAV_G00120580 [Gymnothorax javanicus]|nr:hypothetical protein GJAV_G00120580 [Gymnothorax javanicus]